MGLRSYIVKAGEKAKRVVSKGLENLARGSVVAGVGLASALYSEKTDAQQIIVSSQLPRQTFVADGQTIYQMNVNVDSTQLPDVAIRSTNWKVYAPGYFSFVDAQLPLQNDFFEGFPMQPGWNFVDTTASPYNSGWVLDANTRNTDNPFDGPSNHIGDLENIYFTVNTDAPLGPNDPLDVWDNFGLYGVNFSDTTGALYNIDNGNLSIYNDGFTIISPCYNTCGDINGNGGPLDLNDFSTFARCFGETGPTANCTADEFACSDMNNSGKVDLEDFSTFATFFGQTPAGTCSSLARMKEENNTQTYMDNSFVPESSRDLH
jgi:hypothetical protein